MVNCSKACAGVTQIDIIDAADMTREKFTKIYAYRGQPLVVRNATQVGYRDNSVNLVSFFKMVILD